MERLIRRLMRSDRFAQKMGENVIEIWLNSLEAKKKKKNQKGLKCAQSASVRVKNGIIRRVDGINVVYYVSIRSWGGGGGGRNGRNLILFISLRQRLIELIAGTIS